MYATLSDRLYKPPVRLQAHEIRLRTRRPAGTGCPRLQVVRKRANFPCASDARRVVLGATLMATAVTSQESFHDDAAPPATRCHRERLRVGAQCSGKHRS